MTTVSVEVDVDLSDFDDRDLIREMRDRNLVPGGAWGALKDDLDFQMAVQRGDREAVFDRVSDALRITPIGKAA